MSALAPEEIHEYLPVCRYKYIFFVTISSYGQSRVLIHSE